MKFSIFALLVLFVWGNVSAQEAEHEMTAEMRDLIKYRHEPDFLDRSIDESTVKKLIKLGNPDWKPVPTESFPQSQNQDEDKFNWKGAMWQSAAFLALQHGFRFKEEKTRTRLKGPFFRDWKESVRNLRGWDDGGKFFTNYIAHTLQGAMTARIFINNSGRAKRQEFGRSSEYWKSRLKALAWAAAWSAQFEIGPISEASLGNVGQELHNNGRSKLTYADFVLTPVLGTGLVVAEDIIDKYVLKNWLEKKGIHRFIVRVLRSVLAPAMTFANPFRIRTPWTRDFRRY